MKKILAIALAIAALPALAVAQSSPNLTKGQVLTAGQWNALFVGKQDTLGFIPLNTGGGSMSGRLITAPPGATLAGFSLTPGTAPASPVDGDMWATSLGLYVQVSGSTVGPMTSAATPCTNCAVTNATNTFLNNQIVNLGGGAAPAAQAGMILQGVGAPATIGRLEIDTFAAATIFTGIRADGTVGVPTTLVANDEIVSVNAWGYDGTSRSGPASGMRQYSGGTWSNTSHPTYIDIATTPAASTTLTSRLRVESDGGLTINGASSGGLGSISGVDNSNRVFSWSMTNTNAGTSASAQLNFTNLNGSASFGTGGSANSNASLANKAFIFSGTGLSGISLYTGNSAPIDFFINGVRAGGFTTAGALDLGVAGTAVGSVVLHNATSGGVTLSPVVGALGSVTVSLPAATTRLMGNDTTDTMTNKTFDTAGVGNALSIAGVAVTTNSGTGAMVRVTGAALVTPTATSLAIGGAAIGSNGLVVSGTTAFTSAAAAAFTVGLNGATNPAFQIDASTASSVTGLKVTSKAATGGVNLDVISSGTNEGFVVNAKGSGGITIGNTSTGAIDLATGGGGVTVHGSFTATGLVGYAALSSGAVASCAQYAAATASTIAVAANVFCAETTTTFGSTTTFDFSTFINTAVTLTANITTQTLSNVKAGQAGTIRLIQDATGSRTTVWNSIFKWVGGVSPSLSTTANAIDVLSFSCVSATNCPASLMKDVR